MKNLPLLFSISFVLNCLISNRVNAQDLTELSWIIGNWECLNDDKVFSENWHQLNDTTLVGEGKLTQTGKVLFSENLRIEKRNQTISYIAILSDKTVSFPLDKITPKTAIFLNVDNDFPSRITYHETSSGMNVTLEGFENEEQRTEALGFTRKPTQK